VRRGRAGLEAIPAAEAEVEHTYDAHRRKAAAGFLAERLGIGALVRRRVGELDAAAVDSLEDMAAPKIGRTDGGAEMAEDPRLDADEELRSDATARLTVTSRVTGWPRKTIGPRPSLDKTDSLGTGGVALEDLGPPRPKHRDMSQVALADSGIDFLKKGAGPDAREHQGIASDRVAHGSRALASDGGSQPALGGGKNRPRKAGQERLFGHTL